jgi:signal transduction histidine kinase
MARDRPATSTAVRLRTLATAGTAVLATLAVLACGGLVTLSVLMQRSSNRLRTAIDEMHAAEGARVNLLAYGRVGDLFLVTKEPKYELMRTETEENLFAEIGRARASAASPEHIRLVEEAESKARAYLVARRRAEAQNASVQEILISVTPALEEALDAMERLVSFNLTKMVNVQNSVRRWDTVGQIIGVLAGVFLLFGFAATVFALQRLVFFPLLSLSDGIDRFAAGEQDARVSSVGPVEFRRTASSFNGMADRIQRRRSDLLAFLAGVAHDLRNPLAALRMATEYLEPGRPLPGEDKTRKTLALVARQVTLLERMVGDFLDACRIEGGHLELAPELRDLRETVHNVLELYSSASDSHHLRVIASSKPVFARVDPERIEQVLNNLLSNAIKYSPGGGEVIVRVEATEEEALVGVTDHGIGIGPDDLEQIFEPFQRTGASRGTIPGVGLGLSVARRIVEAHGGRIEVLSQLGAGSTFRVHLPLAQPPGMGRTPAETQQPAVH